MKINSYSPDTMGLIEAVTGIDFGTVIKGQHSKEPIVIKPLLDGDETFSRLALFLESTNGMGHTQFGMYKNSLPITGVNSGGPLMVEHFKQEPGITGFGTGVTGIGYTGMNYTGMGVTGMGIGYTGYEKTFMELDPKDPEFIWLDAQAGSGENSGENNVTFRFLYEYN